METVITFISGIIVAIVGLFFFNRNNGGVKGVESSIRRAGEHIDRARGGVNDIADGLGDVEGEIKECGESVERLEEVEQRHSNRIRRISGLIKRGRKALESIERKNTASED